MGPRNDDELLEMIDYESVKMANAMSEMTESLERVKAKIGEGFL